MHELSICQAVVDQVVRIAAQHRATGVEEVVLRIGPLAGVVPELLHHAFPFVAAESVCAGARLTIQGVNPRVACGQCGAEEEAASLQELTCPRCGSGRVRLSGGDELDLMRVVLRTDSPDCAGNSPPVPSPP